MTNAKETLLFLANFNSWRRGNDDAAFPDPAEVGAAIDDAVNLLRRYDDIERENAALRADKERLDWLQKNEWYWNSKRRDLRKAIDRSRKEVQL
jgi:hypothetical protein